MHPTGVHTDSHTYAYDAAGRLLKETASYDGGEPVTVQQLSYNAVGQLASNDLGAFAEAYTYNMRGAMTKRKSDVFEQTISFSNHFDRLYNGSIGMITDKLTGGKSTTSGYSYDNAGRLTSAMIFLDGITRPTGYTYDLNGNITALNRRGYNPSYVAELIDDLVYQYDGNQVRRITEKAPVVISEKTMNFVDGADEDVEYTYDRNGNMTSDANKGISLFWDANNRLGKVENDEMTMSFGRTGSGMKLSKNVYTGPKLNPTYPGLRRSNSLGGYPFFPRDSVPVFPGDSVISVYNATLTEYFGAYEYVNGRFSRLNTPTGYRDSVGTHVYVRDWQGNIRAVVRKGADGKAVLEQATYYYPYGMPMAESTNPTINRYKYTDKELLTDHGVNIMDYGARFYDPVTGLWLSADPLSSLRPDFSPYRFNYCNPINFVDPSGLFETREEASEWAKSHGIKTGVFRNHQIEQQEDKTWAIVNRSEGFQYDRDAGLARLDNVLGMGDDGVVKSAIGLSSEYSFAGQSISNIWNSGFVRSCIPDFYSVGFGFSGSGGISTISSIELNWVLRGSQASILPIITVSQSIGAGTVSADATINIGKSWYIGNPNNITRNMVQTSTFGDQSYGAYGSITFNCVPSVGVTFVNSYSPGSGSIPFQVISGYQLSIGAALSPGASASCGTSNTFILYDFAK